jgi:hypothetical protein
VAFPADPLPIKQQLLIDGTWTDITSDTRGNTQVTITRGYSGEQANLSPGNAQFTINNRNGDYTNRNPLSPYYRKLGRNTQYRTGIDTGVVSARFTDSATPGTADYDGSCIWTADKAGLDITGDIDICVDVDADDWRGRRGQIFVSKYLITGDQRSWAFLVDPFGYLQLIWSTDGTVGNRVFAVCPTAVNPTGRVQYRVQLDVNNGAGGWTCSFYTGSGSITGTYTLLDSVSGTGTTSIFSSSARLEVGDANAGASWNDTFGSGTDADPFVGKFYGMLLRSGIAGTGVAAMRADLQTAGATSWVDSVSNTWTVEGSTYLDTVDYRFWGEVPSLPNRWDISGSDIYIPTRAADLLQRLTSGGQSKPLRSAVYRNLSQYDWGGYWPMEDAFDATSIAAVAGSNGFKEGADFEPSPTGFAGSAGALIFNDDDGTASGLCRPSTGTPATTTFLLYFKFDTVPPSATYIPLITWQTVAGTARLVTFAVNNSNFQLQVIDGEHNTLVNAAGTYGTDVTPGEWVAMRIKLSQSGSNVTWEHAWYQVDGATPFGTSGTYAGTMSRPWRWSSPSGTGKFGQQIAHVAMGSFDFDFIGSAFTGSTNGFNGENWANRVMRLGGEESIPVWVIAPRILSNSTSFLHTMGPQAQRTFVELLQECADVAGGILYAPRDKFGLTVRSLEAMISTIPVEIDYAQQQLSGSLEPEPDDFLIENDVTLSMADGTTYRYVKTEGSLNTQEPADDPDGVGVYDVGPVQINLGDAADLKYYAERRVSFGTVDEARFPTVGVQLERALFLASATLTGLIRRLDLGRKVSILNPPAWLPPGPIELMTSGYVEVLGAFTNALTWNTRPAQGWTSGYWGSTTRPTISVWGAANTTLKTGVDETATSLTFTTTHELEEWSTSITDLDVEIAGERMTVTAMGARSGSGPYEQIATVTRSINGIIKSLDAGETVTVVDQGRWI